MAGTGQRPERRTAVGRWPVGEHLAPQRGFGAGALGSEGAGPRVMATAFTTPPYLTDSGAVCSLVFF